jgi:hypothetical protein
VPLPSLRCQTHELGHPRFIAAWHISDIFPFKLAVRDSYKFERREGRTIFKRIWRGSNGEVIEVIWWIAPVKRGVDGIRRGWEEDRSTDVDVETVDYKFRRIGGEWTWICGSVMFS